MAIEFSIEAPLLMTAAEMSAALQREFSNFGIVVEAPTCTVESEDDDGMMMVVGIGETEASILDASLDLGQTTKERVVSVSSDRTRTPAGALIALVTALAIARAAGSDVVDDTGYLGLGASIGVDRLSAWLREVIADRELVDAATHFWAKLFSGRSSSAGTT